MLLLIHSQFSLQSMQTVPHFVYKICKQTFRIKLKFVLICTATDLSCLSEAIKRHTFICQQIQRKLMKIMMSLMIDQKILVTKTLKILVVKKLKFSIYFVQLIFFLGVKYALYLDLIEFTNANDFSLAWRRHSLLVLSPW